MLISSDLPEVLAMSDRVLVMREGEQTGLFDRAEATQERVMTAAVGRRERAKRANHQRSAVLGPKGRRLIARIPKGAPMSERS